MSVNPPILGHQGTLRIYLNGQLTSILTITEFSVDLQSSMQQEYYVGNAIPEGWQSLPHFTGTIDMNVKDSTADTLMDAIVGAVQNGVGFPQVVLNLTENYADGTSSTYAYNDVQFKLSRRQRGGQEKVTKKFDFQAMSRFLIA